MANHHAYDTDKRIIYITTAPTDGLFEYDVQIDLYSDIKEDWLTNADLNKFALPIRSVGGDPLPGSKTLGDTYFLDSDWKIRPYEADHKFAINGNLFSEDGTSVIVPTIGSYNVLVEMFVSNLSDSSIQQLTEIEYSVYNGGVSIDTINGRSGTSYPVGTPFDPVNNVADAISIVANQNLPEKIWVLNDLTLGSTATLSNYLLEGRSHVQTTVTIEAAASVSGITLRELDVNGTLDGSTAIQYCIINNMEYLDGHIHNCSLNGTITLGNNADAYIVNCSQLDMNVEPEIDMGGSGQDLVMPDFVGIINITNLTGGNKAGIGLNGGRVVLDSSTVTNGLIHVSGIGSLMDELGNHIGSGTWNGGVTIINELVEAVHIHDMSKMILNKVTKSGDIVTVYDDDGITVWKQYDLASGGRVEV